MLTAQETINIVGVKVHPLRVQKLHQEIEKIINSNQKALVLNVNVNCLNLSYENPWMREFLNTAEIVFCDGAGVILGAYILGAYIPERITYADWFWELSKFGEAHKYTFYFLGAEPSVAQRAAETLLTHYPNLRIVGIRDGYFDKSPDSQDNEAIIRDINLAKPNILVLGLGMPLQEKWLMENWHKIDANIALTGGAVFDYISGKLKRAPRWMTNHGLEWLGRLLIEPQRLWKRYLFGNPQFLWRILKQKMGFLQY